MVGLVYDMTGWGCVNGLVVEVDGEADGVVG